MGLLDRFRGDAAKESWQPPLPGMCACKEHVDALVDLEIGAGPPVVVKEIAEQVTVAVAAEPYVYAATTAERRGPYEWRLCYTPVVAGLYDADAPAHIDDMVFIQEGIGKLLRIDEGTLAIGAAELCQDGVAAAFFRALASPRVRRPA